MITESTAGAMDLEKRRVQPSCKPCRTDGKQEIAFTQPEKGRTIGTYRFIVKHFVYH